MQMFSFRMSISLVAASASVLMPTLARSACLQDHAIYADKSQSYHVRFQTPTPAAAVSHVFTIEVAAAGKTLDGNMQETDLVPRSLGTLLYQCPEGDVTGADLEACTVWQGLVYAVDGTGTISNLPDSKAEAANQLLFADFGAALRQSTVWTEKLEPAPYDVFVYSGCRP